ncbi:MAG: Cna B-type domain-containing protein [Eubacteriales bacterium]
MKLKFLLGIFLVFAMAFPVGAAESGSLYIDYHYEDLELPFAGFHLYQVYELDTKSDYIPTSSFEDLGDFQDFVDNDTWLGQGQNAENFILANNIAPDITTSTDERGKGVVEGLEEGIYLLQFDKLNWEDVSYVADSVLLMIPGSLDGDEEWAQSLVPKVTAYDEESPSAMDVAVMKYWRNDNSSVRPSSVDIGLYQSGNLVDTVTLTAEMEWFYLWNDLDPEGSWAVKELNVASHYTETVTFDKYQSITIFYVTNTYNTQVGGGGSVGVGGGTVVEGDGYDTDVESDDYNSSTGGTLTQTGAMLLPVPILILSGMFLILVGLFVRKEKNEEET